jgi:hypothetical protein
MSHTKTVVSVSSLLLLIAFSSCSTPPIHSNVTTFHPLPPKATISGKIFIVPAKGIPPSLEFQSYASHIYSTLESKSFVRASSIQDADYIGVFFYGIDGGRDYISSIPIFGQTGGGTTFHTGSIYGSGGSASYSGSSFTPATFGVTGVSTQSGVLFTRIAALTISQRSSSSVIWQGRNMSSGSSGEIAQVLPTMIQALLKDFPGTSGKTRLIVSPLN